MTLKLEHLTAIIDTREQTPLDLAPLAMVRGTRTTGDYSLRGLEPVVAIERKSKDDLVACVGRERERFDKEVTRLLAYPVRALVVESTWQAIEMGEWRSKVKPLQVEASLLGWAAHGLPVVMAGNHERAGRMVGRLLWIAARRRHEEARALMGGIAKGRGTIGHD